jgi:hypothetical protein
MRLLIKYLNLSGIETLACCCGHGKYPMTIVVRHQNGDPFDICHYKFIPRKKRFYTKDKYGYYFIPETLER